MESFETYRPYLFAIAYRMLGSAMDAEDMVQETYLRYQATPPETITSLKAFLTTIISRLCMDQLHLARRKRELYLGPWLPEPIITPQRLPNQLIQRSASTGGVDLAGVPAAAGTAATDRTSRLPAARGLRVRLCGDCSLSW